MQENDTLWNGKMSREAQLLAKKPTYEERRFDCERTGQVCHVHDVFGNGKMRRSIAMHKRPEDDESGASEEGSGPNKREIGDDAQLAVLRLAEAHDREW